MIEIIITYFLSVAIKSKSKLLKKLIQFKFKLRNYQIQPPNVDVFESSYDTTIINKIAIEQFRKRKQKQLEKWYHRLASTVVQKLIDWKVI